MITFVPCAVQYPGCFYRPSARVSGLQARKPSLLLQSRHRCQQISANKGKSRRPTVIVCSSAASVIERYEEAEAKNPIRPLRHPFASWRQWWYIGKQPALISKRPRSCTGESVQFPKRSVAGATPQSELPKSQKFSRICARLWGIMKHSKTSLSFAVTFMVRSIAQHNPLEDGQSMVYQH